jgi:hypothetical protein
LTKRIRLKTAAYEHTEKKRFTIVYTAVVAAEVEGGGEIRERGIRLR